MKRKPALVVSIMVLAPLLLPALAVGNPSHTGGHSTVGDGHATHAMPASSAATGMSEGEVRKVDAALGKVTLRHGPLENLNIPGMTMVFRVKDPAWLPPLKVGERVRFVAERVDGNLTITALEADQR